MRTLIERVIVQSRTEETIAAVIHWMDHCEPTVVEARLVRFARRLIREFAAQGLSNSEIAKRLNEMGILTSGGKLWTNPTYGLPDSGRVLGRSATAGRPPQRCSRG